MNIKLLALLLLINFHPALLASETDELSLSLDKLFNLKVTSVSGTEMSLKESPAAVYVITPEDMRAQGHLTIADALRNVPGFHVAQINSSTWAITSRGFNSRFANKLLVLIDGRSVYTPLFSGVYWDAQDMVLEDIDRIEVIRGPGATLWGANAVNCVINIETNSARDSLGTFLKLGSGSHEKAFTSLRHGD
ncbi:MAG: Plug domain-containing protein, partial [Lentisphaeraceae bacterium]|nr:Plug domain-containing protein [Lentisphaeraceae bacterium]